MIAKTEVPVNQFFIERRSFHRASKGKETDCPTERAEYTREKGYCIAKTGNWLFAARKPEEKQESGIPKQGKTVKHPEKNMQQTLIPVTTMVMERAGYF